MKERAWERWKKWQRETASKEGERKERAGGAGKENRKAERGSCSVFIYLLISILTSRFFISLASPIHLSIQPSTHSASNQSRIHSLLFIDDAASLPSHLIMHPSFYQSLHSPFTLLPIIYPSLYHSIYTWHCHYWLFSFIYIGFCYFLENRVCHKNSWRGVRDRYATVLIPAMGWRRCWNEKKKNLFSQGQRVWFLPDKSFVSC